MANYPIVLFALGIFAAFPATSEAFSQGSFVGLDYVNFVFDEFYFLNITGIGRNLIQDENECGFACLEIPSCFSYNVAASPDINGKLLCELLPSDKYNNSHKFLPSQVFHHFSMPSQCSSSPCTNNGRCISLYQEKSCKCVCKDGFTGQNCQTDINECESRPCLNNGTCTDRVNGFNCSCPPGFAGDCCETDINECVSRPCLNNGTCIDQVNGFNCSCPPGFAGNCCETELSINSTVLAQFLAPAVGNVTKWLLCYRASIHGWAGRTFHRRCDGKPNTITIIRNGPYVFGGYTDVSWGGSGFKYSNKSFIFSLRDNEGLAPFKSKVNRPQEAIYSWSNYGPVFGNCDICIFDNANTNRNSYTNFRNSYSVLSGASDQRTILAGTYYFTPDEVEVFYLG